jgi:1-hydroxycarotenoid 3,4-desaturase
MNAHKVVVIGAGIGGLVAALRLAHAGCDVTVCEAAGTPGGKLREMVAGGVAIDAGPTVFTLKPIFEAIFASVGERLEDHLALTQLDCLARHGWEDGTKLDLFGDTTQSEAAIGEFAGAEAAHGYRAFSKRSAEVFETLDLSFMQRQQPGLLGLMRHADLRGLMKISPFTTLWDELGKYFTNPKLRQLFGRYATYCGASPFTAPATLLLIAHAEQRGVWTIEGGMHRLARVLAALAQARGAAFRYDSKVAEISAQAGKVSGVVLANGEVIAADAVIANPDVAALDAGYFGANAKAAVAGMLNGAKRSLSAMTWAIKGSASGFELAHHNVFFARDYKAEFDAMAAGRIPEDPTVYVCAPEPGAYFCLINAPANGDAPDAQGDDECLRLMLNKLQRCGLTLTPEAVARTGPTTFNQLFPATGGALYGRALTGWRDSFQRPGSKTRLPGLYLAGGSVHPGPGLPMAAFSGALAAAEILHAPGSSKIFAPGVMPGGMSTRSAMTAPTRSP